MPENLPAEPNINKLVSPKRRRELREINRPDVNPKQPVDVGGSRTPTRDPDSADTRSEGSSWSL